MLLNLRNRRATSKLGRTFMKRSGVNENHQSRARGLRLEPLEDRRLLSTAPVLLQDTNSVSEESPPTLVECGGAVYFTVEDAEQYRELWKSDGLSGPGHTQMVKPSVDVAPNTMVAVGNTLYFEGWDEEHNSALWKSNGTEGTTVLVKDFDAEVNIYPHAVLGEHAYFSAGGAEPGIWKTTGTAATTTRVVGPEYSIHPYMFAHGNALYFQSYGPSGGSYQIQNHKYDPASNSTITLGLCQLDIFGSGLSRLGFYGWLALLSGWE